MDKCTTIIEKRKQLIEVSKVAKALRESEQVDGTINYMLLNYIYETGEANEFKTFEEWQKEGYGVRKGAKAFVTWGKPREKKTERGEVVKYYPISYLFSDLQVYRKRGEVQVEEKACKYENFCGEIKVSYKQQAEPIGKHVNSVDGVVELLRKVWNEDLEYRESFYVVAMNNNCDVLGYAELFRGGVTCTVVDVKMIFQLLLSVNATSFVVAHNHPSGSLRPSPQDVELTKRIVKCAKFMDLAFVDHVILTPGSFYSFVMEGQV